MFSTKKDIENYPTPTFDKCTNASRVSKTCDIETLKSYIKRDLENLLNSRRLPIMYRPVISKDAVQEEEQTVPETESDNSYASENPKEKPDRAYLNIFSSYGLSDFSTRDLSLASEQKAFAEEIKMVVESFENRLRDIDINMAAGGEATDRVVRLKIGASLNCEKIASNNTEDREEEVYFATEVFSDKKLIID